MGAWLKQPEMRRTSVVKSGYATSHLIRLLWYVAPRLTGDMKSNTIKTHLVLHIHEEILNFGVPEVMNSSYAESGHITICKDTTRTTQKRSQTFTEQAALRYVENLAIKTGNTESAKLCGKQFIVYKNSEGETLCHRRRSSKKSKDCLSEVEEDEVKEDGGVEEPAKSTRERKTQTEKAQGKKTQTDKPPAKKAPTRKKPRNMPKPLTPIKKPPSKNRS